MLVQITRQTNGDYLVQPLTAAKFLVFRDITISFKQQESFLQCLSSNGRKKVLESELTIVQMKEEDFIQFKTNDPIAEVVPVAPQEPVPAEPVFDQKTFDALKSMDLVWRQRSQETLLNGDKAGLELCDSEYKNLVVFPDSFQWLFDHVVYNETLDREFQEKLEELMRENTLDDAFNSFVEYRKEQFQDAFSDDWFSSSKINEHFQGHFEFREWHTQDGTHIILGILDSCVYKVFDIPRDFRRKMNQFKICCPKCGDLWKNDHQTKTWPGVPRYAMPDPNQSLLFGTPEDFRKDITLPDLTSFEDQDDFEKLLTGEHENLNSTGYCPFCGTQLEGGYEA